MTYIAERELSAIHPKHGAITIRLKIGTPYAVGEADWACPVVLDGLYSRLADQHGVDSWQALMLAQHLARTLLKDFVSSGGHILSEPGGKQIDVDQLFIRGI